MAQKWTRAIQNVLFKGPLRGGFPSWELFWQTVGREVGCGDPQMRSQVGRKSRSPHIPSAAGVCREGGLAGNLPFTSWEPMPALGSQRRDRIELWETLSVSRK